MAQGVVEEHGTTAGDEKDVAMAARGEALSHVGGDGDHQGGAADEGSLDAMSRHPITLTPLRSYDSLPP